MADPTAHDDTAGTDAASIFAGIDRDSSADAAEDFLRVALDYLAQARSGEGPVSTPLA